MKNTLLLLGAAVSLIACNPTASEVDEKISDEINRLKEENKQLNSDLEQRDSSISWFMNTMIQIDKNLADINDVKSELTVNSEGLSADERKKRIEENLNEIQKLRQDSKQRIASLQKQLNENGIEIEEYQMLVADLQEKIDQQDDEIAIIREQLQGVNVEYTAIFDAYLEKAEQLDLAIEIMETAYYCYGSFKELQEAGVVTKEGGFGGIGKVKKLKSDFNKNYFETINTEATEDLTIPCKKQISILTNHPEESYQIEKIDDACKLIIKDHESFWDASKYLVIVVD